ncbi:MAG: 4Fe-4S binding protein [Oscillospiraceae bacterium]|nr:4Fe-4S binding protein [Oscillospiraceae bacterium]
MNLTEELLELLHSEGAALAGIADMRGVTGCAYSAGAAVALPLPRHIVRDLKTAPTQEYLEAYSELNRRLNAIVTAGEQFLLSRGCEAYAQTTERISAEKDRPAAVPHKTVATRAGLGWIGKNCLLVTPRYGSAVRLSSILTNAPLKCDEAIDSSRCGNCALCVAACPGGALHGTLWHAGAARAEIVDVDRCYDTQREVFRRAVGGERDLCGKCFAVCAYTQKYLAEGGD